METIFLNLFFLKIQTFHSLMLKKHSITAKIISNKRIRLLCFISLFHYLLTVATFLIGLKNQRKFSRNL